MSDEHEELKALLRRNLELTRENNKILKRMRRGAIISTVIKIVFWAIVIGVPIYIYYFFVQPSISEFVSAVQDVQSGVESSRENLHNTLRNLPFIGNLLENGMASTSDQLSE